MKKLLCMALLMMLALAPSAAEAYWLDISAFIEDPQETHWGWKTSYLHWEDDAVWGHLGANDWQPLHDPRTGETLDMAFVITPEPASICLLGLGLVLLRRR